MLAVAIDYDCQALRHPGQIGYLMLGETAGLIGDECHHVGQLAHAGDRQRQIIGAAAFAQFAEDAEIEELVGPVEAPTQRLTALTNPADRIFLVGDRVGDFMLDHDLNGLPRISPPGHRRTEELRVEGSDMERDAQHRDPGRDKAPGELIKKRDARPDVVDRLAELLAMRSIVVCTGR
ncbi:MAG: hypothetical protein JO008_08100 [Alphaproteobacteria bacterium]|nr:hypothetical protein [Alphaproteobacteria bacterium]